METEDKHRYKNVFLETRRTRRSFISSLSICVYLWLICFAVFALQTQAQVRPVYDRGATGLMQLLKRLNTTASVLMIGAHPDDEDTALLAYLARGESARTAYLSLTRGDGGQNIIGPELGEALGVIRTEELLQARRLDGAEQYFTRAYDYGFSKTLDEAKSKWDEKVILCDTVRVIRNFRPLVVISQFSGTTADGHGQHQFAGYISPLAVKAAADATQCTDAGAAWQVKKFYFRHRGTGEPTLRINTGKYDPLLGRSYFEIAMEARSQHKSQEQGVLELKGDQFSQLSLVGSSIKETSIFEGIDTSLTGILKNWPTDNPFATEIDLTLFKVQRLAEQASREVDIKSPTKIVPILIDGYSEFGKILGSPDAKPGNDGTAIIYFQSRLFLKTIEKAIGFRIDALADVENVVPGESVNVTTRVFFPETEKVLVKRIEIQTPEGWRAAPIEGPKDVNTSQVVRREIGNETARFKIDVPANAKLEQPYWLLDPRDGEMYRWPIGPAQTRPFNYRPLSVKVFVEVTGKSFEFSQPVEFRYADDVRGEIRRDVDVVPKVTVEMDQPLIIVPYSDKSQTKQVVITVINHSRQAVAGSVSLNFNSPAEWKNTTSSKTFELKRMGEKTAITFDVTIPAKTKPGDYQIYGQAIVGEALANMTMKTVAYSHIQTHRFYRRTFAHAKVVDLKTSPLKVGYITGSGDRVAEAIRQMGFDVEIISERDLASGSLSKYGAIVVGIRAYQVRPDVVANNQRLLDYTKNGGTLIVQYQLPGYSQANLMPFPAQQGPRVADENAKVTILDPKHPTFNVPNKITDADFEGWVQERNLYNFSTMDAAYTPLLESHDTGEAENKGGLVIAKVGKGNYIYCSYSMFRQLPAGVPGAYRLFANLLSFAEARTK